MTTSDRDDVPEEFQRYLEEVGVMSPRDSQEAEYLPLYNCHKQVRAVYISAIEFHVDGSATIAPVEKGCGIVRTKPGYRGKFRGDESSLGVYVRYEDGYESWSPAKAFEDGYTRV